MSRSAGSSGSGSEHQARRRGPGLRRSSPGSIAALAVELQHPSAMQEHQAPVANHSARFIVEQGRYEHGVGGKIQTLGQLSQANGARHGRGRRLFEHKQKSALDREHPPRRVEIETRADGEQLGAALGSGTYSARSRLAARLLARAVMELESSSIDPSPVHRSFGLEQLPGRCARPPRAVASRPISLGEPQYVPSTSKAAASSPIT